MLSKSTRHSTLTLGRSVVRSFSVLCEEAQDILRENNEDKEWARAPESRSILAAGIKTPFPSSGLSETSMEAYLSKRGWNDVSFETNPSAHRTLTAALTFPLTLAHGINQIFHGNSALEHGMMSKAKSMGAETIQKCDVEGTLSHVPNKEREKGRQIWNKQPRKLKVMVLGARAEASLPALWWREGLINTSSPITDAGLRIGMLGPNLPELPAAASKESTYDRVVTVAPSKSRNKVVSTSKSGAAATAAATATATEGGYMHKHCEVSIPSSKTSIGEKTTVVYYPQQGRSTLHEHPDCMKMLLDTDMFVLFHPGMGHDTLKDGWTPTIELLLQSKKPVLCTAHSMLDLERDIKMLHSVAAAIDEGGEQLGESLETLISGRSNPFASTRRTYDPKETEGARTVTTNQFIHAFRSK